MKSTSQIEKELGMKFQRELKEDGGTRPSNEKVTSVFKSKENFYEVLLQRKDFKKVLTSTMRKERKRMVKLTVEKLSEQLHMRTREQFFKNRQSGREYGFFYGVFFQEITPKHDRVQLS